LDIGFACVSDLWKAEGKPSAFRPDRWRHRQVSQHFHGIEAEAWEAVKGGIDQGTWASLQIFATYANALSKECGIWVQETFNLTSTEPEIDRSANGLPIRIEDFNGEVRFTDDGRIAVYDGITFATGHKNPRQVWSELEEKFPEVVRKSDNFQFPGQGQRETPVATLQVFLEILTILPGRLSATVREESVRTLIRAMNGDASLVEEILNRINNPEDLEAIENAARQKRSRFYPVGEPLPGSMENPLTAPIKTSVRQGLGWAGREVEMEGLLSDLATYRGMFIQRQVPYRPYSETAKRARSRRIDLILRSEEDPGLISVYHFESDYIDEADVADIFLGRSYPQIVYRELNSRFRNFIVYLVSPSGISDAGVERLKEAQGIIDKKCDGRVRLSAMRLDELVWGEMYPAIEAQYQDKNGWFGQHYLNNNVRNLCESLCQRPALPCATDPGSKRLRKKDYISPGQISLF